MIHRLFAICDLSAHNSASFNRAGNDAVLLQFSQTCDWLLIWAKWSSAEEAQLQISTFCERRSATTSSEYINRKHFDFLYKPAIMNSSDGRDFSATSSFIQLVALTLCVWVGVLSTLLSNRSNLRWLMQLNFKFVSIYMFLTFRSDPK